MCTRFLKSADIQYSLKVKLSKAADFAMEPNMIVLCIYGYSINEIDSSGTSYLRHKGDISSFLLVLL